MSTNERPCGDFTGDQLAGEVIELDDRVFELVCVRHSGVAVYRGNGVYLRLGNAASHELELHRQMLDAGYPVADILEVGEHAGSMYYIEASLGPSTLGDEYADGNSDGRPMSGEQFAAFLYVMRQHAHAQLNAPRRPWRPEQFSEFIGVGGAVANNPDLIIAIQAAWAEAAALLGDLPATLQHGDLHPFNTCQQGVIDLEDAGWAPAGYDVAAAVFDDALTEPRWKDAELTVGWFTSRQVGTYLGVLDEEFLHSGLPAPSTRVHAYLVCRAITVCSRVHPNASFWQARQRMLARALPLFLENGRFPLTVPGSLHHHG